MMLTIAWPANDIDSLRSLKVPQLRPTPEAAEDPAGSSVCFGAKL